MRHRYFGKILSRDTNARKALFRNLAVSLIEKERITTTHAKAKAIKGFVDRIISKGKNGSLHKRRQILSSLANKKATAKVIDEIAPRFEDRISGFTRIIRLGPRKSDTAKMAILEFVQGQKIQTKTDTKKAKNATKITKKVKKSQQKSNDKKRVSEKTKDNKDKKKK